MEHILRSEDIEFTDQVALETSVMPVSHTQEFQENGQAQAQIIESHPDHAVIEVICSCGKKIYIRCDY